MSNRFTENHVQACTHCCLAIHVEIVEKPRFFAGFDENPERFLYFWQRSWADASKHRKCRRIFSKSPVINLTVQRQIVHACSMFIPCSHSPHNPHTALRIEQINSNSSNFDKYAALTAINSRLICNSNHRLIFNAMNVNLCNSRLTGLTVGRAGARRCARAAHV